MKCRESVFFLDYFTTKAGYKFEEKVRDYNNLSRCYRIDSRSHDLMQLTDLLLGVTTYLRNEKQTTSTAKLLLVEKFEYCKRTFSNKKTLLNESVYIE